MIFFVAPDSYSAMNAATAGAFVLSESYLYTKEMIVESLEHLDRRRHHRHALRRVRVRRKPNRTARYVGTARRALESLGVEDASRHLLVATSPSVLQVSTILVKRRPFTEEGDRRVPRERRAAPEQRGAPRPGRVLDDGPVAKVISLPSPRWTRGTDMPYDVTAVVDDKPFFWHFAPVPHGAPQFGEPLRPATPRTRSASACCSSCSGVSAAFAGAFLLLPFVAIRKAWSALPRKGTRSSSSPRSASASCSSRSR